MVSETTQGQLRVQQAIGLRAEAMQLLCRLEADKLVVEERLAQAGKRDAMKAVTGASAIEEAIKTARGMIRQMDELLKAFGGEFEVGGLPGEAGATKNGTQAREYAHGNSGMASEVTVVKRAVLAGR